MSGTTVLEMYSLDRKHKKKAMYMPVANITLAIDADGDVFCLTIKLIISSVRGSLVR